MKKDLTKSILSEKGLDRKDNLLDTSIFGNIKRNSRPIKSLSPKINIKGLVPIKKRVMIDYYNKQNDTIKKTKRDMNKTTKTLKPRIPKTNSIDNVNFALTEKDKRLLKDFGVSVAASLTGSYGGKVLYHNLVLKPYLEDKYHDPKNIIDITSNNEKLLTFSDRSKILAGLGALAILSYAANSKGYDISAKNYTPPVKKYNDSLNRHEPQGELWGFMTKSHDKDTIGNNGVNNEGEGSYEEENKTIGDFDEINLEYIKNTNKTLSDILNNGKGVGGEKNYVLKDGKNVSIPSNILKFFSDFIDNLNPFHIEILKNILDKCNIEPFRNDKYKYIRPTIIKDIPQKEETYMNQSSINHIEDELNNSLNEIRNFSTLGQEYYDETHPTERRLKLAAKLGALGLGGYGVAKGVETLGHIKDAVINHFHPMMPESKKQFIQETLNDKNLLNNNKDLTMTIEQYFANNKKGDAKKILTALGVSAGVGAGSTLAANKIYNDPILLEKIKNKINPSTQEQNNDESLLREGLNEDIISNKINSADFLKDEINKIGFTFSNNRLSDSKKYKRQSTIENISKKFFSGKTPFLNSTKLTNFNNLMANKLNKNLSTSSIKNSVIEKCFSDKKQDLAKKLALAGLGVGALTAGTLGVLNKDNIEGEIAKRSTLKELNSGEDTFKIQLNDLGKKEYEKMMNDAVKTLTKEGMNEKDAWDFVQQNLLKNRNSIINSIYNTKGELSDDLKIAKDKLSYGLETAKDIVKNKLEDAKDFIGHNSTESNFSDKKKSIPTKAILTGLGVGGGAAAYGQNINGIKDAIDSNVEKVKKELGEQIAEKTGKRIEALVGKGLSEDDKARISKAIKDHVDVTKDAKVEEFDPYNTNPLSKFGIDMSKIKVFPNNSSPTSEAGTITSKGIDIVNSILPKVDDAVNTTKDALTTIGNKANDIMSVVSPKINDTLNITKDYGDKTLKAIQEATKDYGKSGINTMDIDPNKPFVNENPMNFSYAELGRQLDNPNVMTKLKELNLI